MKGTNNVNDTTQTNKVVSQSVQVQNNVNFGDNVELKVNLLSTNVVNKKG